jgi:uncharacterized protein (TIGR03545 family)
VKWIRPSGALAFIGVVAAIGLFWWLLADWLLKTTIETVGTKAVGAKVELAAADLTLSPLGFSLHKLQVTDPKQPMHNLFELDNATGNVELLPLLEGQVIIDEMSATGLRFDTQRPYSGALRKPVATPKPTTKETTGGFDFGAIKQKLPTVDDIVAREKLSSVELTKAFQANIKTQRSELKKSIAALPDEAVLKQQEQRIKELTSGQAQSLAELQKREKELEKLKDQIRAERDKIKAVRDQIHIAKQELTRQYQALQQAPAQDWERISSRYGLSAGGAGNIARLLFGDAAKTWFQRLSSWGAQVKRILPSGSDKTPEPVQPSRGEGRLVHFPTNNPLPDFLIRHAALSLNLKAGDVALDVEDITHQPQILGRPMRIQGAGDNLRGLQSIKINGVIDHVNPAKIKDLLSWSFRGWQLSDIDVSKNPQLPLTIASTSADLTGKVVYGGKDFISDVDAKFQNTQWNTGVTEGWAGRVASMLKNIHQFTVDGKIQGDFKSPNITLRSDLDEQLKQAVSGQLKAAQKELQQKLQTRLNSEIEKAAGPYNEQLSFLTKAEDTAEQRIKQLDQSLKAELKSAIDQKKQQTTDKLKNKLKGLKF